MSLRRLLIKHEGLRLKPYKDTVGKLTIGVGRNLDDKGISEPEAMSMLDRDIQDARDDVLRALPWVKSLDSVRQDVVLNMVFNIGISRFLGFKKTLEHMESGDFGLAAKEMLDSKWAKQVGARAIELSEMMRTGQYKA